jgi:flagellin-specific chaperone FliS
MIRRSYGAMSRETQSTDYYVRQIVQCAAAANAATIAEIKDAYLNLEQGWRHLLPTPPTDEPAANSSETSN